MYIETDRLIVRRFKESDAGALYKIKTDSQVMKYIPDFLRLEAALEDIPGFIREFDRIENSGDIDTWRCYAIENKQTGEVMGSLSFGKSNMLYEYTLGWQMIGCFTGNGYASEAAAAFAEYFCETYNVDYLIAVMDIDNPASFRTAEKSGFKLFEKRTVYDCTDKCYYDDYYYLRRYYSGSAVKVKFYGDCEYEGRSLSGGDETEEILPAKGEPT